MSTSYPHVTEYYFYAHRASTSRATAWAYAVKQTDSGNESPTITVVPMPLKELLMVCRGHVPGPQQPDRY